MRTSMRGPISSPPWNEKKKSSQPVRGTEAWDEAMIKVGVINVTGYAGAELARLLYSHPEAELVCVTGRSEGCLARMRLMAWTCW